MLEVKRGKVTSCLDKIFVARDLTFTDEELSMFDRALGFPHISRNFIVAVEGSSDFYICERLAKNGYLTKKDNHRLTFNECMYIVTQECIRMIVEDTRVLVVSRK